ncbi:MAG: exonuclease domain-containing protein [Planctomycetota bacterium]
MDFTAIDFETANRRRDSACQLATVVVRDSKIVDSASWLIKPRPFFFLASNIGIHGIRPDQVEGEPTFGELWPEIQAYVGNDVLVAHNASFDLGVLLACLRAHQHPAPDLQYSCTRAIARATWNRRSYGLKPLGDWLGIRFRHHDALEDSIACAKVMLAAAIDRQVNSLEDLESKLRLTRGTAGEWGFQGPKRQSSRPSRRANSAPKRRHRQTRLFADTAHAEDSTVYRSEKANASAVAESAPSPSIRAPSILDLQRLLIRGEFTRPLSGQRVVFTGTFTRLPRESVSEIAERLGGRCQNAVSDKTNLLVVGSTDRRTLKAGRKISTKQEAAEKLLQEGNPIRIVSESEFLQLCQ